MSEPNAQPPKPGKSPAPLAYESQGERWAKYGSNVVLTCVIVVALAVFVIWAAQMYSQKYRARVDLTVGSSQSLKPQTINIISSTTQPIKLVSLYARLQPNQVGQQQDFYTPVVDLLDQYKRDGKNVSVEVIDPVAEPAKLDAWLGEVTRKYGGAIKSYRDVLVQFPKTLEEIKKLADDQAKQMQALRGVELHSEDQAEIINEAYSTVKAFPALLGTLTEGINDELAKKIPDYKGQVESVRSSVESFSRQDEGVQKDLDILQKDKTAPQQVTDLAKKLIPQFQQMKKLADDLLAKIKGLGELKIDEIRRQIVSDDENGDKAVRSIAVEGDNDFRLVNFSQVWKTADTSGMRLGPSGPPRLRFSGEQQITAAILSLKGGKKPKVAFVRAGGPPLTSPMFGQAEFSDIADRLKAYNFEILEKDLSGQFAMQMMQQGGGMAPPEPSDEELRDAVWIVFPLSGQMSQFGPQPVNPEVIKKIEDHLNEGGSALMLFQPHSDSLAGVLSSWGIDVKPDIIICHEPIQVGDQVTGDFVEQARRQPPIFVLNQYGDSPVTKTLQSLDCALVPLLPVETHTVKDVSATKIIPVPTDLKTWGESDLSSIGQRNGNPTFDPKSGDLPPPLWGGAIAEKQGKGRVVVLGNASFVANQLLRLPDPKLPRNMEDIARFPGNGELFTNSVFWLSKLDNLIALSPAALDTTRIQPINDRLLFIWRFGVLLIGLPLLVLVAGLVMYQVRKD
jgi:hypothetical protein